jgi:hypothetical protein
MKKYLVLLSLVACFLCSNGQDLKRVHLVYVQVDDKNPDTHVYGDEKLSIKFLDIEHDNFKIQLANNSDENIEFIRKKSYTVINGSASTQASPYTYLTNEIIPKNSTVTINVYPGSFFDYFTAKKYYKNNRKPVVNKLNLAFLIGNSEKDMSFDVSIYPKKSK